jgi:hypothetical protein
MTKATKTKLNDKVKIKKDKKKLNIDKFETDESKEVKRFIIILLSIIVAVLAVYGITRLINKGKDEETEREVTAGEIDYDKVSVGTLFNRADSEYYVIVYDGEDANAIYYSALMNKYMNQDKAIKVYFCDLSNALNKKYYVGEEKDSNPKATKPSELALKDLTLIKIKKGKIVKYIESLDTIKTELGI